MSKNLVKYGLLSIALIVFASLFMRSCSLYQENAVLKGKYEAYRAIAKADHEIMMRELAKQNQVIEDKTKEIEKIKAEALKPSAGEIEKDKVIAAQNKKLAELEAQGDLAGALSAAKLEIQAWSEKFTLAEERHKSDLFNLDSAWQAKFDAQVIISDGWKKDRDNENALRVLAEKRIGGLESSLKITRFWKNTTTILAVVGAGYVGYKLIGGK